MDINTEKPHIIADKREGMEERIAIARLKKGDLSGLDELVKRYQVKAVQSAYLITLDRSLAEDIVQESFIHAFDKLSQFDDSRPFGPWFYRSVANLALKAMRHQHKFVPIDPVNNECQEAILARWIERPAGVEAVLENKEAQQEIWQAICRLPVDQRAVIVMRYYQGLNEHEMIVETGRPASTIKWWLHEARTQLRRWLGVDSYGPGNKRL
ncbi:MAG TPA: sigma-70 family RNA polymerase sigma factor [Anaerolineaceae bacterium]|nr:sigma-70 family RNA polymerase sigma factor [Anaerolineaceae bacterium]